MGNIVLYVFNIYAPVKSKTVRLEFIKDLHNIFPDFNENNHILVCGDFNTVVDNHMDIIDTGAQHDPEVVSKFNEWFSSCSLIDSWRLMHQNIKDFTWSTSGIPFRARRLDHIFIDERLLTKLTGCEHIIGGSDHKIVSASFKTDNFKRGQSFWKFNSSLLSDTDFLDIMNTFIDDFLSNYLDYDDPMDRFEMLKIKIKSKCIEYCTQKGKKSKNIENILMKELITLNTECVKQPNNIEICRSLENKKKELELMQVHKARGALVRARAQAIRDGEKNSKFFLSLEKSRGDNNTITTVHDPEQNKTIHNQFETLKHIKDYYEKIAKKDHSVKNT